MNKALKKKRLFALARALESGKFRKATGALKVRTSNRHYAHCCLGVACEIAARSLQLEVERTEKGMTFNGQVTYLPTEVRDYYGFASVQGHFNPDIVTPTSPKIAKLIEDYRKHRKSGLLYNLGLATLNDDGVSHRQIAKFIRKNWMHL